MAPLGERIFFFFNGLRALVNLGLLNVEVLRSHLDTPQLLELQRPGWVVLSTEFVSTTISGKNMCNECHHITYR